MTALPNGYKYEHVEISGGVLDSQQALPPDYVERLLIFACEWAKRIPSNNLGYPSESIFYAIWKRGAGIVTNGPHITDWSRDAIALEVIQIMSRKEPPLLTFTMQQILEQRYYWGQNDRIGASRLCGHDVKFNSSEYQQYARLANIALWMLATELKPLEARYNRLCECV